MDVAGLSNEELRDALKEAGITPGPIMATTRKVWERKLLSVVGSSPPQRTPSPTKARRRRGQAEEESDEDSRLEGETSHRKLPTPISSTPSWEAAEESFTYTPVQSTMRQRSTGRLYPSLPEADDDEEEQSSGGASFGVSILRGLIKAGLALVAVLFIYFLLTNLAGSQEGKASA